MLLSVVGMACARDRQRPHHAVRRARGAVDRAVHPDAGSRAATAARRKPSLKYFVLGSVASAILLYGMALLYTATGSVDLAGIGRGIGLVTTPPGRRRARPGARHGRRRVQGRARAVPPVDAGRLPGGADQRHRVHGRRGHKAAGFAAILRLYLVAFPDLAVAVGAGAVGARRDLDAVRRLGRDRAARRQADAGLLVDHPRRLRDHRRRQHSDAGLSSTLWYLLTYAVATVGAFGCVIAIERRPPRRGHARATSAGSAGPRRCWPASSRCACCRWPACRRPPGSSAS